MIGASATVSRVPLAEIDSKSSDGRLDRNGIAELAASMKASGLVNPITLRPTKKGYQLVAGRRRFAAAELLDWPSIPAIVAELTDDQAITLRIVENDQREDAHPLDQAANYLELQKLGHSLSAIATMVGRSEKHVYDRVRLAKLIPDAQQLFRAGKIGIAHAILISRLKAEDQERTIKPPAKQYGGRGDHGLWRSEGGSGDLFEEAAAGKKADRLAGYVACTANELQDWIDNNVRFDRNAPDLPQLFEATAANMIAATEKAEKIIPITQDPFVQPEARDPKERTYGPMSWKRADGEMAYDSSIGGSRKSKTCDRSALGVIVAGEGRGQTLRVCADKNCKVHWPEDRKKARASAKAAASGNEARLSRLEQQRKAEAAHRLRWKKATPAIIEALAKAIAKAPATPQSAVGKILISRLDYRKFKNLAPGKTAESLARYFAFQVVAGNVEWQIDATTRRCAEFGIDWKQILEEEAPVKPAATEKPAGEKPEPAQKAKSGSGSGAKRKKTGKRGGR